MAVVSRVEECRGCGILEEWLSVAEGAGFILFYSPADVTRGPARHIFGLFPDERQHSAGELSIYSPDF